MWSWLVTCALSLAPVQETKLTGIVSGPDGPIEGATVLISTARPKRGVPVLCPSCYIDCRKEAGTDGEGEFVLEDLDPELLFRLLVYAPGYVPKYSDGFSDPELGEVEVELEPRNLDELPPDRVLRGRVVDPKGEPVAFATLMPRGKKHEKGMILGGISDVDTLAMSDEKGEFAIACSRPGDTLLLMVSARGFAPRMSPWITAGAEPHTIALDGGVTVTGIMKKNGQALGGVELGLAQVDRRAEVYLGDHSVGTTPEGRFTFFNVPSGAEHTLYGRVATFKTHGALAARPMKSDAPDTTVDVGVVEIEPGHRLAGRIELSDGKALPEGLRVILDREAAWDAQVAEVRADGTFAFEGLPVEVYTLNSNIPGYVLSPENGSFDFLNHDGLLGRVEGDVRDLALLFEPGEEDFAPQQRLEEGTWERYEALRQLPLRGVAREASAQPGR